MKENKIDILVIGAHPDDAEVGCGGTIKKMVNSGLKVVILDLTQGEAGSRGSIELRAKEAEDAANILGVAFRDNLKMPDSRLVDTIERRDEITRKIREYQPKIIFSTAPFDRHPDHAAVGSMVKAAFLYARLKNHKLFDETGEEILAHSAEKLYFYPMHEVENISFVVDITDTFADKMAAIKAFSSQFYGEKLAPHATIGTDDYPHMLKSRAGYFGALIRKEYGEAFIAAGVMELNVSDLM